MQEKENYLKNAELATEQNYNLIDGVLNNVELPPEEEKKQKDRVIEPPRKKRSREREDR